MWNDANGNGVQDPGESGLGGVEVTLYGDADENGFYDTVLGVLYLAGRNGQVAGVFALTRD